MINLKNKGFTLIELLVVIAIIGILSAVVLASLSSARNKGKDASMVGSLSSLRAQAEMYSIGGSYANLFTSNNTWASTNSDVQRLLSAVQTQNGTGTEFAGCSATAWAAQAQLPSTVGGTASYFCVDSTGVAKTGATAMTAGATVCPS
jgi:prepilin-type N-terminal cleavage/methylation domain-containing protein